MYSDKPLYLDYSPPLAGTVRDGPNFGQQQYFTHVVDRVSANWQNFMDHQSGIDLYRESAIVIFQRLSCAEWAVSPGVAFNGVWSYNEGSRNSTLNWRNLTAQTFTATLALSDGLLLEHNTTYYSTIISYNRGVSYIVIIGAFC